MLRTLKVEIIIQRKKWTQKFLNIFFNELNMYSDIKQIRVF